MFRFKQIILWTAIVIAFTPLAFILMPVIAVAAAIGAISTMIDRAFIHHDVSHV